ncbi:lipoprotein-releasing ABC transporter permease subunit [Fluoribacter gormanii]|uniref:lipoprotein-releasing ABC transporter permease subunit n=1 Tax=Fluoribacter gormanii TaxID=464 RepID=UPI002244E2CC|nr:lipoprotein-releasing ABC transporter permease subunit [Fluoribacter gormanii]MCW8469376.1 lipoprotein-releasing ABC transporter permease subunit [Fluoribacter gormanii]
MFKPLVFCIGLRYIRSQKKSRFVSFISLSSMLGISLGVMVLITVLSVMNGFDEEIHTRYFTLAPEVTITEMNETIKNWKKIANKIQDIPEINAISPYVNGRGLATHEGQVSPIMLTGILPKEEQSVSLLKKQILMGNLDQLGNFGIILGRDIASRLGVTLGDKITVLIPTSDMYSPTFKQFIVQGIFSAGSGFGFDGQLGFINIKDAQKLLKIGNDVSGIKIKINNVFQAPEISDVLSRILGADYQVGNWTQQLTEFFQAIKMQKNMMFLILLLIIMVAAFNLVSSLVMIVNDKQAEIAILRTLGATPAEILLIFIVQGMIIGVIGILLGSISGLILAKNVTSIVNKLQSLLDYQFLSSNIYFVDYLPSKILLEDLLIVCLSAILMSFIATIYPAWRASRMKISESLHYA